MHNKRDKGHQGFIVELAVDGIVLGLAHILDQRVIGDHTVIIGAGPADSHLGFLLARAGVKVAIVDQAVFPRDKLCGGLLTQKTLSLLEKAHQNEAFPFFGIKQMRLIYKRHCVASVKPLSPVNTVCRREFDALLVEFAATYGAHMYLG